MKDQRQKTGGRKQGTPNKLTAKVREDIQRLIEGLSSDVEKELQSLTLQEKAQLLPKLLSFVLPKPTLTLSQADPKALVIVRVSKGDASEIEQNRE